VKKKLVALVLCIVMMAALALPAYAAPHSLRFGIEIAGTEAEATVGGHDKSVAYVGQVVTVKANESGKHVQSLVLINQENPKIRIPVLGSTFVMPAFDVEVVPTVKDGNCAVVAALQALFSRMR